MPLHRQLPVSILPILACTDSSITAEYIPAHHTLGVPSFERIPMSYDILVFDPAHAPKEREAFLQWWDAQAEWSEPHPYNDPAFTTPSLRAWFMEMIERFPALGGPYAASRDRRAADYCIGY